MLELVGVQRRAEHLALRGGTAARSRGSRRPAGPAAAVGGASRVTVEGGRVHPGDRATAGPSGAVKTVPARVKERAKIASDAPPARAPASRSLARCGARHRHRRRPRWASPLFRRRATRSTSATAGPRTRRGRGGGWRSRRHRRRRRRRRGGRAHPELRVHQAVRHPRRSPTSTGVRSSSSFLVVALLVGQLVSRLDRRRTPRCPKHRNGCARLDERVEQLSHERTQLAAKATRAEDLDSSTCTAPRSCVRSPTTSARRSRRSGRRHRPARRRAVRRRDARRAARPGGATRPSGSTGSSPTSSA